MFKVTTKGLLVIAVSGMLGLGLGAMYVKKQELKEALLVDTAPVSSETVVSPPIVDAFVEPTLDSAAQEVLESIAKDLPKRVVEVIEEPETTVK